MATYEGGRTVLGRGTVLGATGTEGRDEGEGINAAWERMQRGNGSSAGTEVGWERLRTAVLRG
jgi:hypothetical protein